jgi:bifunctional non-homologous end joining protein LigD
MPSFIPPCLPTLRGKVPIGDRWLHEIKFDGYRVQGRLQAGIPTLLTRNGHDWTHRFGSIAAAIASVPANDLVLDGEIIVADDRGASDFNALTSALKAGQPTDMLYYAFDLLHLDGFDLRGAPLIERKRVLAELIGPDRSPILVSEHLEADGPRMLQHACDMGLEGVVSKLRDAPYRSGRSESWIKVKCVQREAFVIVGFVPDGARSLAALYLGRRDGKALAYVGKAGTGFTVKSAGELRQRLDSLVTDTAPLKVPVRKPKATWVKPVLRADIEYRAVTGEGLLRAASYKGLAK